jgi:membrane fusion protein (multidrug efflux system)
MKQIILLVLACVLFIRCNEHEETHHNQVKFSVTSPIKMDTVLTKDYVSQIHSIRHIELRALERGYLQSIFVDEGQAVTKGQKMFQIMPNIYQAELEKAEAEQDAASIEFKNTKLLADGDVVSPNELAMAQANYNKAKAQVLMAQTHLGFATIKAPFDGIMDHFHVREGSLLDEGELLTTLSDNRKMWVYFNVPEAQYLDYMMSDHKDDNKEVSLLLPNNKVFHYQGIVETIEGEFNNETGNIAFRATFPNPEGILRHGQTGSILMRVPMNDALIIPQKATFEVLSKKFVFIIDKNNIIRQREITIGAELPHLFIVEKGLSINDRFLLEGLRLVKVGDKIAFDFVKPQVAISKLELYAE